MGYMKQLAIEHGRYYRTDGTIRRSAGALALSAVGGDIWKIGNNPHVGEKVHVKWLRNWGKKPAGYEAVGRLIATFCVNGRTLIGELSVDSKAGGTKKISCPWNKKWLEVAVE
jgi:hypothetical protein